MEEWHLWRYNVVLEGDWLCDGGNPNEGTQGEKAQIFYKEEDDSHMGLAYESYFDMSV